MDGFSGREVFFLSCGRPHVQKTNFFSQSYLTLSSIFFDFQLLLSFYSETSFVDTRGKIDFHESCLG